MISAREEVTYLRAIRCPKTEFLKLNHLIVGALTSCMGPFPSSYSYLHILVCVDYITKWVEAILCVANDSNIMVNFLKKHIFTRIETSRVLISDGGKHFYNKYLKNVFKKYDVKHKVATLYHLKQVDKIRFQTVSLSRF